jgi:hypothetical protein
MTGTEKDVGRLEGQVEQLVTDMQQVTRLLLGNGERSGILERIICQEALMQQLFEKVDEYNGTGKDIRKNVLEIKGYVQKHVEDKDLHSWRMFLNKKIIAFVLGSFVFFHTLIESGGPIFQQIKDLFGF